MPPYPDPYPPYPVPYPDPYPVPYPPKSPPYPPPPPPYDVDGSTATSASFNPGFCPVIGRPRGALVSPDGFDSVPTFAVGVGVCFSSSKEHDAQKNKKKKKKKKNTTRHTTRTTERWTSRERESRAKKAFNNNWKLEKSQTHSRDARANKNKARDDRRDAPEGLSPAPGTSHGLIASPDASGVSFVDDPPFVKVVVSHGFGGGGVPTDILFIRHFPRGTFSSPALIFTCRQ